MFGLYWDRTCLNTDLCNSLESHGAPAQPGASVQTITLSLVKGWAVSRCTESAAPELYKEASNSTQALLHFRQSSGVCLCLLHSCLCAPQTDCWVHPCTAGGGHQVPRQLALLSSPLWLAAQLQRCDKVLYVLCLVTVCLRCLLFTCGLRASQLQRTVCLFSQRISLYIWSPLLTCTETELSDVSYFSQSWKLIGKCKDALLYVFTWGKISIRPLEC